MRTDHTRLADLIKAANDSASLGLVESQDCDTRLDDYPPAQGSRLLRGIMYGFVIYGSLAFAGLVADYYRLISL